MPRQKLYIQTRTRSAVPTKREREYLLYSCANFSRKEIALLMGCAEKTVENFRNLVAKRKAVVDAGGLELYKYKTGLYKKALDLVEGWWTELEEIEKSLGM